MGEKIIEFLVMFWDYLKPFWIVEQYNGAVILRWGKYHKTLTPGFHWKIPFADSGVETVVVPTTIRLQCQSLSTKDERCIIAQAIIKYQISDVKVLLLEVYDPLDAIGDMTQAIIKNTLMEKTWDECRNSEIDNQITIKARREAKKWGLEIIQVTLVDLQVTRSLRLISNSILS